MNTYDVSTIDDLDPHHLNEEKKVSDQIETEIYRPDNLGLVATSTIDSNPMEIRLTKRKRVFPKHFAKTRPSSYQLARESS